MEEAPHQNPTTHPEHQPEQGTPHQAPQEQSPAAQPLHHQETQAGSLSYPAVSQIKLSPQKQSAQETVVIQTGTTAAPQKIEEFATDVLTFQGDNTIRQKITISIGGSVQKGSSLSKFTAYSILGEDDKGKFETCRRYSEFDTLRGVLLERWPGCFIPVLPDKSMTKNSQIVVQERERMLENFLKCVAYTPQMFYSEEFQLFLRSPEADINNTLEKLPKQSLQDIINKYKDVFTELAGKQIGSDASIKISVFKTSLRKVQQKLPELEQATVAIAESKDILNEKLPSLYKLLQAYEKNTIVEFAQGNQDSLIYFKENVSEQFAKHEQGLKSSVKNNPFWLFSDLVKLELKDSQSLLDTMNIIDVYNDKRMERENDIRSYEQEIEELTLGRTTMSSMTTRKPKEEVRKIIEEKNKKCIVEKHQYMQLTDMVVALLAHMQIDNYKNMKRRFYTSILRKFSGCEAHVVLTLSKMWEDLETTSKQNLVKIEAVTVKPEQPVAA